MDARSDLDHSIISSTDRRWLLTRDKHADRPSDRYATNSSRYYRSIRSVCLSLAPQHKVQDAQGFAQLGITECIACSNTSCGWYFTAAQSSTLCPGWRSASRCNVRHPQLLANTDLVKASHFRAVGFSPLPNRGYGGRIGTGLQGGCRRLCRQRMPAGRYHGISCEDRRRPFIPLVGWPVCLARRGISQEVTIEDAGKSMICPRC